MEVWKMKEASTVKIISSCEADIKNIISKLEQSGLVIFATSGIIFDRQTKKYHQFVSVS